MYDAGNVRECDKGFDLHINRGYAMHELRSRDKLNKPRNLYHLDTLKNPHSLYPNCIKNALDFVLVSPPPAGSGGRVRTAIFLRPSGVVGRFRLGSGGLSFHFDLGLKCSWVMLPIILHLCFRIEARFRQESNRESHKIGPPAGRRPAGGPSLRFSRHESGRNPGRELDSRPGSTIA